MKRIICLLLGFSLLSLTVSAQEVSAYMLKNLIRVKAMLVDDKGKEYTIYGGGFIVDGKYLATTYSLFKPTGFTKKPKRMVVYYNYRVDDKQNLKNDSVDIDLLYKYIGKQYDFSKHVYQADKLETDFIVLKLKKVIPVKLLPLSAKTSPPKYSNMPILAFDNSQGVLRNDTLIHLFLQFQDKVQDTYQLVMFGPSKPGFSGSPIFNERGEIMSIIQFGLSEINEGYIEALKKAGWLTDEDIQAIRKAYASQNPRNFIFSTNINYLMEKYVKGFR
ncbi:hypothetical protein [Emticicia soli]|uniref:Serine protease n=1 Tax=Emticicia soli TaxID=2027878 RepID=A0ABW5JAA9_9BACT